jgi:hypothetical protein
MNAMQRAVHFAEQMRREFGSAERAAAYCGLVEQRAVMDRDDERAEVWYLAGRMLRGQA